jgi:hypothetical protein
MSRFLMVAGLACASASAVEFAQVLSPLDSPADLARWVPRENNRGRLLWQLTDDPETKRACCRLVTSAATPDMPYPGIDLPLGAGRPLAVGHYAEIVFEAKNLGATNPPLQLVMLDDLGVARYGGWEIKPGWNTYRVTIPKAFQERKLAQLQFGYDTPTQEFKICLANLRLENNQVAQPFELLAETFKANEASLTPALRARLESLRLALNGFDKNTREQKCIEWLDAIAQLDNDLHLYLVSLKVKQFDALYPKSIWGYAWADGVSKVFREGMVFPGTFGRIGELSLAANEYEGIQLVLRAKKSVSKVRVSVSDLTSPDGAKITSDQIAVLPVGYVNTKRPPYDVDYVGWWPDPLLDFLKTFELAADVWQPVWLDIHAKPGQKPGTYRGTITVTGEGVEPLNIPLEVTVWNFAVPQEKHFPLALNWWDGSEAVDIFKSQYAANPEEFAKYRAYLKGEIPLAAIGTGHAADLLALRSKMQKVLIDHRLNPLRIYNETPPLTSDVKLLKDSGFDSYCILMIWSQRQLKKGEPYPADKKQAYLDLLAEAVPRLKQAGLLDGAYVYGFDECDENEFAAIRDIFGTIKKRWPELKTMTTAYDYTYGIKTGLAEVVDIWVPLTQKYDQTIDQIERARQRGEAVWWYVCVAPEHPYANWFVEYSAAEHRQLMGFMPFKFKSQGFLHYSLNYWKTGPVHTPFKEHLNKGPLTNYDGRSWADTNGDGLIFYPGDQGPVVTIRMKNIRDGLEDYEYLWLLQERVRQVRQGQKKAPEDWLPKAEKALVIPDDVLKSLTSYSRRGCDVLRVRQEIAQLLEQVP